MPAWTRGSGFEVLKLSRSLRTLHGWSARDRHLLIGPAPGQARWEGGRGLASEPNSTRSTELWHRLHVVERGAVAEQVGTAKNIGEGAIR